MAETKELLGYGGGFPVAVATMDARAFGRPIGDGRWHFSLDRVAAAGALREIAGEIEDGRVLLQEAKVGSYATVEDYVLHEVKIVFAIPAPPRPNPA